MIRFATLQDESLQLARLVYETDKIIPYLFGSSQKALLKIKALIERDDNVFSYKNILVYQGENCVIKGVLLLYAPQQRNKKRENVAYSQVFSLFELFKLWFKSIFLKAIEDKSEVDGLYIQNISVEASARGEGIGTKLINHAEELATQEGFTSLWLDVAFDNPKAKKLYEKQGFSEVSRHPILFSKSGFIRMKKNLTSTFFDLHQIAI